MPRFQQLMEDIIEHLLSKDKEEENFYEFCEKNMIEKIIKIAQFQEKSINLIIIKIFGILIPSLKNNKIMFYLFSKNYMNQLIYNISSNKEDNDVDYLSFYINFLKTLVNKLDIDSFSLFFNSSHNKFPLLDEIIVFLTYEQDVMIKNVARNIFLSLLKLDYAPFIEYICDLPTITLFLLFSENLKEQIKYFCNYKDNININNNDINIIYSYKIKEIEEKEEMIIDDISFIQDILSINIPKISYLLINSILYFPISYLLNNILTRQKANISYYILELFLKTLKNECIRNIIIFILYSSHIQIKIIENVANEATADIIRLLKLNKYLFKSNLSNIKNAIYQNLNILSFDDYIILNYSKTFLNSLRYIKDEDNTYYELKDISTQLNCYENKDNDINLSIKLLNKKVDRINYVIKQIENYHGFISRSTGINCGGANGIAKNCFLQVIYNNLISDNENNNNNNIFLQENIFKSECYYYLYEFHLPEYMSAVNELFLINYIIKNEELSEKLKLYLNLIKNPIEISKNNNNYVDINSIEESDNNNELKIMNNNMIKTNSLQNFDTPPAPGVFEDKNNINEVNNGNIINFSVVHPKGKNIFKKVFGIDEKDENNKKSNQHYSSFLSLPEPVNYSISINQYNNNLNLIINNKIMNFSDMNFNNEFLEKNLYNNKTNNKLEIIEKLVNLLIDGKRILNKLIYKLCIDIIEDLLLDSINFWQIKRKYQNKINEHYKQILQMINDFLNKNTLENEEKDNNYFYEYFEDCFNLNTKNINDIKNNIFKIPILLTNPPKPIKDEKIEVFQIQLDLLKIPEKKNEVIKCIFQKMLSLYDLKYIINNFNDVNKENLIKYQKFPLFLFDLSEYNIESKIDIYKLKIESYKLKFKDEQEDFFTEGIMFIIKNYIFTCIPNIENKVMENKINEENKKEGKFNTIKKENDNKNIEENFFIIKQRIPLRNIQITLDYKEDDKQVNDKEKEKIIVLNINNNKSKILFLFENYIDFIKIRDLIKDNIKKAIEIEYKTLKDYINKLLTDYSTINY